MQGHEVAGSLPQGRDGSLVLLDGDGEGVLLVVVGHELEHIVVDVTVQLDVWLDSPVPVVVLQQRVSVEETGLEAAHVSVGDGVTVDDLLLAHVLSDLLRLVLVDPGWEGPVLLGDQTVLGGTGDHRGSDVLELLGELLVVQEDPVVLELGVEAVLDGLDGLDKRVQVSVTGQGDEGGALLRAGVWLVGDTSVLVPVLAG